VNERLTVHIGMRDGSLTVQGFEGGERLYKVQPVGTSVQELWVCGGLEGYILKSIQADA